MSRDCRHATPHFEILNVRELNSERKPFVSDRNSFLVIDLRSSTYPQVENL